MLEMPMNMIESLKQAVAIGAISPEFIHNKWYLEYHLELVEKISLELCDVYQSADKSLVLILVWLHDFNKIFNVQAGSDQECGASLMQSIGFSRDLISSVKNYVKIIESRNNIEIAPLEVKIVSSADGASHFIGPFFYFWWYENPDVHPRKLMQENYEKALRDWNNKIVLPEIKQAFKSRFDILMEQCGILPNKYL